MHISIVSCEMIGLTEMDGKGGEDGAKGETSHREDGGLEGFSVRYEYLPAPHPDMLEKRSGHKPSRSYGLIGARVVELCIAPICHDRPRSRYVRCT